ncbi:MAG: hypothetical protein EZS28_013624 [Streblomastix strix]|uniref:Uncharacterized protein n=1 Tax=Streblomastix strix TaxID=222440 RepID=A0A5J4W8N3_9EUKA|nr:MAG: hypothetical protein EZS28_013621 [Streblomastix strix]KAA6390852.1 MAG: hypothetical protein EZS28_013624 [Streblomastix strix]
MQVSHNKTYINPDDTYLPAKIKNQGRYIRFIRDDRKPQKPRINVSFDEVMKRQGGFAVQRQAQARALAEQVGPAFLTLVVKLAKDFKIVKALINVESAANLITDRGLQEKGWAVKSEDLDKDVNTPNNVIVTNPSGFYSIDGYRAVEPKQRFLLNQYYGTYPKKAQRRENNYGSWYDEQIRPLIPAAIGKQLFNKAVQIVFKNLSHIIDKQADQQTRLKQQMTYLKCASYIWKKKFIEYFAAMNADQQYKATFKNADYFALYRSPDSRKIKCNKLACSK